MSSPDEQTTAGHIEDDLATSPVRLRAEIRRLRSLIPTERQEWRSVEDHYEEGAEGIMARRLCMLGWPPPDDEEGWACACPGVCHRRAKQILSDLHENGYWIMRREGCCG